MLPTLLHNAYPYTYKCFCCATPKDRHVKNKSLHMPLYSSSTVSASLVKQKDMHKLKIMNMKQKIRINLCTTFNLFIKRGLWIHVTQTQEIKFYALLNMRKNRNS